MTRATRADAADIEAELVSLREKGLAHPVWVKTGGRKAEVWFAGKAEGDTTLSPSCVGDGVRKEVLNKLPPLLRFRHSFFHEVQPFLAHPPQKPS